MTRAFSHNVSAASLKKSFGPRKHCTHKKGATRPFSYYSLLFAILSPSAPIRATSAEISKTIAAKIAGIIKNIPI